MWVIRPGPSIAARSTVVCAAISMLGDTFQPRPRSRAGPAPVPSVARPPPPGLPMGFSGLIERVTTPGRSRVMSGIMTDRLGRGLGAQLHRVGEVGGGGTHL